jgi:hypothetical protein
MKSYRELYEKKSILSGKRYLNLKKIIRKDFIKLIEFNWNYNYDEIFNNYDK